MNRFAGLLDRLAYEPRRNAKIRLVADYLSATPDPERGHALAAMTGQLSFRHAKAGLIRTLIAERTDETLFALSYDYVGDLSETVALMWPSPRHPAGEEVGLQGNPGGMPTLTDIVETLDRLGKAELPGQLAAWLDGLDETGRWALLKLITGSLRIGVSARLARTAVASLSGGTVTPDDVELVWPGLTAPYADLFAWVEGRGPRPDTRDPVPFRPVMLAHAVEDGDFATLTAGDYRAEWKWDGIRVQAVMGRDAENRPVARLYSRTGEDISPSFPDLIGMLIRWDRSAALDGELLILREGRVQSFNVLQQRLNRKQVTPKLIAQYPAHIRAYDLLSLDDVDLRHEPFDVRRELLETVLGEAPMIRLDLSQQIAFDSWDALAAARAAPTGPDRDAIEGVMIKAGASAYLPGRPKGPWWKWKRDPYTVDAVLMYAQRGHGKRSSYYSDYTFGVWDGDALVPVGKAYFGFTDAELTEIDRFVRRNTIARFGPVREVTHNATEGLVFEIAFEGLRESTRHRSGIAMRFPRIARIRRDKPPAEADRIETLRALIRKARRWSDHGAGP
jgi:DNA ligase-1